MPISEAYGGRYKDADPEVLEQRMRQQVAEKKPEGRYGMPTISEEGHPSLNICWRHSTDNLHAALPKESQDRNRKQDGEKFDDFFYRNAGGL